jgi:hypothetical protein
MRTTWYVTVEKANGVVIRKKTDASDIDEACANIRAKIPITWRIVAAVDFK